MPLLFILALMFWPLPEAAGKIDLVTLSDRESVETTIYNEADLTLVRDKRILSFVAGKNLVQFSWANTRIDPTSLSLDIKKESGAIRVREITYPPGTKDVGIWHIEADQACRVPVEITYFTSGISWQAYYLVELSEDLKTSNIKGYVKVTNASGEDYGNALTRLLVGKINILDDIARLAALAHPFGTPEGFGHEPDRKIMMLQGKQALEAAQPMAAGPVEITKQGVSEYFLYTVQGRETIPHGWSKRLLSFFADQVPLNMVYRYDEDRLGPSVVRFLSFDNKKENGLGQTPLPGGEVKVFQRTGKNGELDYIGTDTTRYIPVDTPAELNLGPCLDIRMVPRVMAYKKENLIFDPKGNIIGFDEINDIEVQFSNFTPTRAVLEYVRNFDSPDYRIIGMTHPDQFEQIDQDSIRFTLALDPHAGQTIRFTTAFLRGDRKWQK